MSLTITCSIKNCMRHCIAHNEDTEPQIKCKNTVFRSLLDSNCWHRKIVVKEQDNAAKKEENQQNNESNVFQHQHGNGVCQCDWLAG